METKEPVWTKAHLQTLLGAMKDSIPKDMKNKRWCDGLKGIDWDRVAFAPFSPEQCREEWHKMLQKMRKIRSLTELIVEAEDAISNPFQNNNKKIHPELPKRTCTVYSIFLEENKAKFKKRCPQLSATQLFEYVINKYKKLPDEEKQKYVEKYNRACEDYKTSMVEFRKKYDSSPVPTGKSKRRRKTLHSDKEETIDRTPPPKTPMTAYNLFCKEQRGLMDGVPQLDYTVVWAQRWRNLSNSQKNEYKRRCQEMKHEYAVKMKDFLSNFKEEEQQQILNKHKIKTSKLCKMRKKKITFAGEPKMPYRSLHVVFCKEQMKHLKQIQNSKNRFAAVQQMWRNLSEKEKEPYRRKLCETLLKYSVRLRRWFQTLTLAEQNEYRSRNPSKHQFLDGKQNLVYEGDEVFQYIPSDSEDEDIEDSEDDDVVIVEDDDDEKEEEEEEEDDEGDYMFEMY